MNSTTCRVIFIVLVCCVQPAFGGQQTHGEATDHASTGSPQVTHDDPEAHGHTHRNVIAGFVGFTGEDRRERALTVGLDYNRWITPSFGIGVGVERAFGDLDFTVYTVPLSWRTGAWKVFAGPGLEDSDHHEDNEFLVRVGVEYAFEVGRMEISPKFMVDIIDGEAVLIGGVAFGRGF